MQVDRSTQLADLYPAIITVIGLPSAAERRADPLAETRAFDPHETSIDLLANRGGIQIDDVGAGAYSRAYIDYVGKARLDAFLSSHGIGIRSFLLLTAEPAVMVQSMDLGEAAAMAQPSAEIIIVLNEHFGSFGFYPGSAADRVWRERVLPFKANRRMITMPAMAAGAWPPFRGPRPVGRH